MNDLVQTRVELRTISEENDAQRIDNYLITRLKGVPKSAIYRILRKGEVRVNKKRVKPEYKLQVGDIVRIPPVKITTNSSNPPSANLSKIASLEAKILFEDDRVIVVNKPSGMAVHGGSGLQYGVIEALRSLRPDARFLELVHRLDRDTSGALMIAKKRSALRHLHEQLRLNKMNKVYHALVVGQWPASRHKVKAPLRKNQLKSGERLVHVDPQGKPSETRFRILNHFPKASLIEAKPISGRTHQIRVHCQHAGHSIAGDEKYTSAEDNGYFKSIGLNRLFLHAASISFFHPLTEKIVKIDADMDEHLKHVLTRL